MDTSDIVRTHLFARGFSGWDASDSDVVHPSFSLASLGGGTIAVALTFEVFPEGTHVLNPWRFTLPIVLLCDGGMPTSARLSKLHSLFGLAGQVLEIAFGCLFSVGTLPFG